MKKKFCSLALLATAGVGSMFMSACGDPALESISVKDGSIETTLLVGSTPDWSDLVLNLNYENDETATATKNADMQISEIDTNVLGEQELVIKYKGLTTKVKVYIVAHEGDLYDYLGYQKPDTFVLYEDSVREAKVDGEDNFMLGTHRYKVGDDNPFEFKAKLSATNQNNQRVTLTEYTSDVTVKDLETGEVLTGDALDAVVAIDNAHSTFDFTPAAVGHSYEITVKPLAYNEDMPFDPITFEIDVVNAWNVYDVANLARVEDNEKSRSLWAAKKQATGIDNTEIEGIVLHNNLEIKKSDLPAEMFYGEGVSYEGKDVSYTLKNRSSFYTRDIDVNDTFSVYGNYFTISTRNTGEDAIPLGKDFEANDFAHSAIFAFGGDNNNSPDDAQGRVVINSLGLIGNGSRQSGQETTNDGALIAVLSSAHNTTLENCITRAFTTHIISDGEYTYPTAEDIALTIKNTKMFDSFSSMVYTWATRNSYIENSVLKKAGGPLVMATHPDAKAHPEFFSNINIKNSVIENYVGGSEAWFSKTGAAPIIAYLRVISGLLENVSTELIGKIDGLTANASFTTNNGAAVNFLSCNIGEDTVMQEDPIKSSNVIKDAQGNIVNEQDMKDELIAMLEASGTGMTAMPIFKAGNVYITLDPNTLSEVPGSPMPMPSGLALIYVAEGNELGGAPFALIGLNDLDDTTTQSGQVYAMLQEKVDAMLLEFFQSDYVNMFYNGPRLGATFEMFHTAPQA